MTTKKAIYRRGECHLQTVVYTDKDGVERVAYTAPIASKEPDTALSDYVMPEGCEVLDFDDAVEQISKASTAKYCKPWIEVTEDTYNEMLGVLPPLNWGRMGFRMSEMLSGDITAHYVRLGGRYYFANRSMFTPWEKLENELVSQLRVR